MMLQFTAVQSRVFGVLIEKALTTPASYPLTLNSAVVGCNQLSCREPVMALTEDDVAKALRELQDMGLVSEVSPERNARVERFRHHAEDQLEWNKYKQAIIAELMLRGPQTPGELKTNASRMAPLPDLDAVTLILDALSTEEPPIVQRLPRQPGKNASRYRHLFSSESETPTREVAPPSSARSDLEGRVRVLEEALGALRQEMRDLRRDVDASRR